MPRQNPTVGYSIEWESTALWSVIMRGNIKKSDGLWESRLFRKEATTYRIISNVLLLLLLLLLTAIELSLGGSSPYTSTHKNKYT